MELADGLSRNIGLSQFHPVRQAVAVETLGRGGQSVRVPRSGYRLQFTSSEPKTY